MDIKTGKIEFLIETDSKVKGKVLVSPQEYQALHALPEQERPVELYLMRFCESRKRLGAPLTIAMKSAFRIGFLIAQKIYTQTDHEEAQ